MEDNFKPKKGDKINVEYHGELMENFFSESTIDNGKNLRSIIYKDDLAILFFIDKKQTFRSIVQINDTNSGWASYEISPQSMEVSTFDIHHDETSNKLKISYARIQNGTSQLMLSDDIDVSNISSLSFAQNIKWESIKIGNTSRKIDHISMNQEGLLYSTSYQNEDATYDYFKYGQSPQEYTLPENSPQVLQLEVGQIYGAFGTFLLYEMKGERTMLFQEFPDAEFGETSIYTFKPSNQLNSFYTVYNSDGDSELYISGNGIYKYTEPSDGNDDDDKIVICESDGEVEFSKIEVSVKGEETTIWVIGENKKRSGLYYITNKFYESSGNVNRGKWTAPLQMQEAIAEFSSVKGDAFTNQLFLLGSHDNSNALLHFWQDAESTNWREQPVVLPELNEIKTLETFTVNVQFKSEDKLVSFHGERAIVSAQENLLVYIGGKKVAIGPNKGYHTLIQDDFINIVYPTKSVAASLLYIETDFLSAKVTIDPSHKLKEKIKVTMGDKEKLKSAKLPDGKPLLDSSISDEDIEQVVAATNQAYDHVNELNSHLATSRSAVNITSEVEEQYDRGFFSNVGHALGDVWHSVKKGFVKITKLVAEKVKDGIKFIIKIGGKIFEWVSKVVSDVFHFLERIWEKIKIFFKDLFKFLAFLFNWKDILHTKRVMKEYLNNIILGLASEIDNVRKKTYSYFDEMKDKIEDIKKQLAFKQLDDENFSDLKNNNTKSDKNDPRANWMNSKKSHIVDADAQRKVFNAVPSNLAGNIAATGGKLAQHFVKLGHDLQQSFSDLFNKFMDVLQNRMKFGDFLEYFVLTLLQLGISTAQEIIDLLFELLVDALRGIKEVLNTSLNIPFFSHLYKKISGDDLSLNDLICLLIAVPTTVLYKIGEGEAPFIKASEKKEFVDAGQTMFKLT